LLVLVITDGKHYQETGEFKELWRGEAMTVGDNPDLREVIN
jgi:hypothetical protein